MGDLASESESEGAGSKSSARALQWTVELPDPSATERFGAALGRALIGGLVVGLSGDLGSGKTTLVRGLLRSLGIAGTIRSPTFGWVEVYEVSSLYFYHFDFYRIESREAIEALGWRDYLRPDAVCLVEWPERVPAVEQVLDIRVGLAILGNGRLATAEASTEAGKRCLSRVDATSTQA